MSDQDAELLERGLLEWIAEDVTARLLRGVPTDKQDMTLRQMREQLGTVLCTAPISGDPVAEVMVRANIAAAFGATYAGPAE